VFATVFQLGGQLQNSQFASPIFFSKETDQRDALKASVAASFSSTYASGSSSYSHEKQSHENEKETKTSDLSTIAWTARGGNSLLSAKYVPWSCDARLDAYVSVLLDGQVVLVTGRTGGSLRSEFFFLRPKVLLIGSKQEEVVTLYDLLGKVERWSKIPELFKRIARKELEQKKEEGGWSGKIKLFIDGKRLGCSRDDTNTLVISNQPPEEGPQEPVFTVLSDNILEQAERPTLDAVRRPHISSLQTNANISQFPTDFPLILVCGEEYSRQEARVGQMPGLFVNAHGWLKPESSSGGYICRWSLRRIEQAANPWNPRQFPTDYIKDGDQVMLFATRSVAVHTPMSTCLPKGLQQSSITLAHRRCSSSDGDLDRMANGTRPTDMMRAS